MNNTFLVRGESVCLEIGFGKVKLVRLGESGRVAHKVGAVFARAIFCAQVLAAFLHVDDAGLEFAVVFGADE